MPLDEVKALLDADRRAAGGAPTRRWWDAMRDDERPKERTR